MLNVGTTKRKKKETPFENKGPDCGVIICRLAWSRGGATNTTIPCVSRYQRWNWNWNKLPENVENHLADIIHGAAMKHDMEVRMGLTGGWWLDRTGTHASKRSRLPAVVVSMSIQFINRDFVIPVDSSWLYWDWLSQNIESTFPLWHWELLHRKEVNVKSWLHICTFIFFENNTWQILYVGYTENFVVKYFSFTFTS